MWHGVWRDERERVLFSFWILGGRWFEVRVVRKPGDVGFLFFFFFVFFFFFFWCTTSRGKLMGISGVRRISTRAKFGIGRNMDLLAKGHMAGFLGWRRRGDFTWSTASLVVFCLGRICFLGGLCASVLGNLI